jgi:hypothetical protein
MRLRTLAVVVLGALASHAAFAAPEANFGQSPAKPDSADVIHAFGLSVPARPAGPDSADVIHAFGQSVPARAAKPDSADGIHAFGLDLRADSDRKSAKTGLTIVATLIGSSTGLAQETRGATHFVTSTDEARELGGQRSACNEAGADAHPGSTHAALATSTDEARRIAGDRIAATQGPPAASNIDLPTSSDEARWLASGRIRFSTSGCDSRLG